MGRGRKEVAVVAEGGLKAVFLNWGTSPPDPLGFIALRQKRREGRKARRHRGRPCFASGPGAALGLVPTSALSSAQAESILAETRAAEDRGKKGRTQSAQSKARKYRFLLCSLTKTQAAGNA